MLNKLIPTISTTVTVAIATLSFSASASANVRVHAIDVCEIFNPFNGQPVTQLIVGEYFPFVKSIVFANGDNGVQILYWNLGSKRKEIGNVRTYCFESRNGTVLKY